jgi:hypothetical protein
MPRNERNRNAAAPAVPARDVQEPEIPASDTPDLAGAQAAATEAAHADMEARGGRTQGENVRTGGQPIPDRQIVSNVAVTRGDLSTGQPPTAEILSANETAVRNATTGGKPEHEAVRDGREMLTEAHRIAQGQDLDDVAKPLAQALATHLGKSADDMLVYAQQIAPLVIYYNGVAASGDQAKADRMLAHLKRQAILKATELGVLAQSGATQGLAAIVIAAASFARR